MLLIVLLAGISYANNTLADLKQGDTIVYLEQTYTVQAANTKSDGKTEITLTNGDKIIARSGTSLSDIATKGESYAQYVSSPPSPTPQPASSQTPTPAPAAETPAPQTANKPAKELKVGDTIKLEGNTEKTITTIKYNAQWGSYQIKFTDGTTESIYEEISIPVITPTTAETTPTPTPITQPTPTPEYTSKLANKQPVRPGDMTPEIEELEKKRQALEDWKRKSANEDSGTPFQPGIFIAQFLASYDQYRGFARFGSLFFTDESWEAYREKVNQAFCDTILLGGTQCWTSRICDTQLYPIMPRSVFSGRTPSGQRVAVATIQGEKSLPIAAVDKQGNPIDMRLYKVTYAINNPYDQQEIKYNVQFRTDGGNTINWYPEQQTLGPGSSAAITEASPILEYGRKNYNTVCLTFNPGITDYAYWHGKTIHEWCSPVIQYEGTATKPYPEATNDPETTPEEPATSTEPPILPAGTSMREDF